MAAARPRGWRGRAFQDSRFGPDLSEGPFQSGELIQNGFGIILNHLYGGMDEPELKIIDVFICKLRKKLSEALDGENHIETVWGRGYVLRDPTPEDAERMVV